MPRACGTRMPRAAATMSGFIARGWGAMAALPSQDVEVRLKDAHETPINAMASKGT